MVPRKILMLGFCGVLILAFSDVTAYAQTNVSTYQEKLIIPTVIPTGVKTLSEIQEELQQTDATPETPMLVTGLTSSDKLSKAVTRGFVVIDYENK